jgi:hypothetical protein
VFEAIAKDLESGRLPLKIVTIADDQAVGLSAKIRDTGAISYHIQYALKDKEAARPQLKIGEHPTTNIETARARARTIRGLADLGIDVQAGLHDRLYRELDKEGLKWRP